MAKIDEPLFERERPVLRPVAAGTTNNEIAAGLCITLGTVKNRIPSILGKLAVRDRAPAALKARELGLV